MTDEKKPPQGAVKGGQRKKLTKSERLNLERLDMLKIASASVRLAGQSLNQINMLTLAPAASVLDDRKRLACGRLCEAASQLLFVAQEPSREIARLRSPWRTRSYISILRRRIARVTEQVDALEALFKDPDDSL